MACQWQDEQTGGHCPTLASRLTGTDKKWFTYTNGTHVDSLAPASANRWFDFLQLYVAKRNPATYAPVLQAGGPGLLRGRDGGVRGDDAAGPGPAAAHLRGGARGVREAAAVHIDFDNGAGRRARPAAAPASPRASTASRWPEREGRTWSFSDDGELTDGARQRRPRRVHLEPEGAPARQPHRRLRRRRGRRVDRLARLRLAAAPGGHRRLVRDGAPREDRSSPAPATSRPGSARTKPSVDLQATVTEVRPDGKETFVQGGWLRVGHAQARPRRRASPWPRSSASASATASRCRAASSPRSRSRSTTRATPTAPARGSA